MKMTRGSKAYTPPSQRKNFAEGGPAYREDQAQEASVKAMGAANKANYKANRADGKGKLASLFTKAKSRAPESSVKPVAKPARKAASSSAAPKSSVRGPAKPKPAPSRAASMTKANSAAKAKTSRGGLESSKSKVTPGKSSTGGPARYKAPSKSSTGGPARYKAPVKTGASSTGGPARATRPSPVKSAYKHTSDSSLARRKDSSATAEAARRKAEAEKKKPAAKTIFDNSNVAGAGRIKR